MVALDLDFFTLINATKEAIQSGFLALHNGKTRCSARVPDWRHGGRERNGACAWADADVEEGAPAHSFTFVPASVESLLVRRSGEEDGADC